MNMMNYDNYQAASYSLPVFHKGYQEVRNDLRMTELLSKPFYRFDLSLVLYSKKT